MSNTVFSWDTKHLKTTNATSVEGTALSNVVQTVKFERFGHDPDTGRNFTYSSEVNLDIDSISDSDFIQYSSLSKDAVDSWIEDNIDSDKLARLNTEVERQIEEAKANDLIYAQMAEDAVPLPWDLTGSADSA